MAVVYSHIQALHTVSAVINHGNVWAGVTKLVLLLGTAIHSARHALSKLPQGLSLLSCCARRSLAAVTRALCSAERMLRPVHQRPDMKMTKLQNIAACFCIAPACTAFDTAEQHSCVTDTFQNKLCFC